MGERKTHILILPFPAQGHINPAIRFGKLLASKGLMVTVISINMNMSKTIQSNKTSSSSSVKFQDIADEYDEYKGDKTPQGIEAYTQHIMSFISQNLEKFIEKQKSSGCPVKLVVYDALLPWALDIAHGLGLKGASFFTQSCAVCDLYFHEHQGTLNIPKDGSLVSVPSLPPLTMNDLPSLLSDIDSYPLISKLTINQVSNLKQADWVFINTFDNLEDEVLKWMRTQAPIVTIGPMIPSSYLDERLKDDIDYDLSLFEQSTISLKWLDSKPIGSVVYVSFGSVASLGENQMEEIAQGLLRSNSYFLWVVRASEESKLPANLLLVSSERGLVVSWCPQLEVLAHKSVGCFVTHCGWNSTLEALSLGVPMVGMPQWADQPTNAKFIADVWRVGVRVKGDDNRIVGREEIEKCIKQVMDEDKGIDLNRNAIKWRDLAKEAVSEGGSSDNNIEEFISKLTST